MTMQAETALDQLDPAERTYVFYPEEPELQIYIRGSFLRFTNGRLIIEPDSAAEQIIAQLRNSQRDFIVTQNLSDPALVAELQTRAVEMCARKAHASQPGQVIREANFMVGVMLSAGTPEQINRMGTKEVGAALAAIMPRTTKELLAPVDFAQEQRSEADDAAIQRSIEADPAAVGDDENGDEAPAAPTPAVDPNSPYADIMAESEEPAPKPEPDERPERENPF